jgi:arginine decarboxylase-like protein
MPFISKIQQRKPLYIGFFNTGAYQETIEVMWSSPLLNSATPHLD